MEDPNRKLYDELGELARYIEKTVRKLRYVEAPVLATTAQIPQASEHLTDLTRLTEEATHTVMALVEDLQDNRARLRRSVDAMADALGRAGPSDADRQHLATVREVLSADERRLLSIMTALSFQDMLGQRVAKIVAILEDVEHKLLEMVVMFGMGQDGGQAHPAGRAGDLLRQLEGSRSTVLKQDLVDDILREFGFN